MRTYHIPDMSCGGCVKAIARIVAQVDSKAAVTADLAAKEVAIDSEASDAALRAALARAGYAAEPRAPAR